MQLAVMMTLADYLDLPGKTATALAAEVGCSLSTITRIAKGQTQPRRQLAKKILNCTKGLVEPSSLYAVAD